MNMVDVVSRVTQFTMRHASERDCWMRAPAISGMLAWGDAPALNVADTWLQRAIDTQRSDGNLNYADCVQNLSNGHVRSYVTLASLAAALGYPMLQRYRQSKNPDYLAAAERQVQALYAAPRTGDGGIWARGEGPELWIDFTYMMCPFLALYGTLADLPDAIDEAYRQYAVHVDHLLDPRKKLARHAWCERPDHFPQSTFWSRGNGWLLCASVDLLQIAPNHADAERVADTLKEVLAAVARYQDSSGYLCHVLDDPHSNLEASGTLMFAYAAARAVAQGLAPREMLQPALRALRGVAGAVEESGKVPGVSVPPGGPGVPFDWTPFGQGFFLLAAHALKDIASE